MKTRTSLILIALAVLALVAVQPAQAATYYWDTNGTTAGFGTAGGTWAAPTPGPTPGWSTSNAGTAVPASVTTTTSDVINFGSGATGLGAGTITVSGTESSGNMTFASGSGAIVLSGGTITLAAAEVITVDNAADTIGSVLAGAATSLTKVGTGTLALTAANSYTGATTVSAGTLTLSGDNGAIASSTGTLAVGTAGGTAGALTLDNSSANNADRVGSVAMSLNNGTINFIGNTSPASTETIGAITAASGSNLINLSGGASDQVAVLTSTGSTITRTAGAAINIVADNINQQFKLTGGTAGMLSKAIYFNSNDFAYLDAAGNLRAPVYGTDSGFAAETSTALTAGQHNKLNGSIASQGAVSIYSLNMPSNYGITALTGNLTFTNSATEGGIIKSGGGAAQIGTAGDAVDIVGQTGGELVFNTAAAADNLTLNVGIAASTTALNKTGAGTLTLTANRDYLYTGTTTVNAGTLVLNALNTDGFKSTAVTINNGGTAKLGAADKVVNTALFTVNTGGTLDLNGSSDSIGALAGSGSVTNGAGSPTLTLKSGTQTFSGVISGTGLTLKVDGAVQTLSGANTYGGGTVINAGTVTISADNNLGAAGGGITFNGSPTVNFFGGTIGSGRTITLNSGANPTFDNLGGVIIAGPVVGSGGFTGYKSSQGNPALTLSSTANTFTGPMNLRDKGASGTGSYTFNSLADVSGAGNIKFSYSANGADFIWGSGAIAPLVLNYRQLDLAGTKGPVIKNNNTASSHANTITVNTDLLVSATGAKTLTLGGSNTGANTFAGKIVNGTGSVISLTKADAGKWILSGANTYSGATTVSAGILSLGNSLALQNSALDTTNSVAGTGTAGLRTTATTLTLGGLTGNKNFASTGGVFSTTSGGYSGVTALTLNPGTGASPSYSAIIANGAVGMTLAKTGAGTQTLSGANSYTGATTISNGTLKLTGAGSINNSPTIDVALGAIFDVSGVSGGYTLGATQTLKGKGTVTGPITVAGTLSPGYSTGTLTVVGNTAINGTFLVDVDNLGASDLLAVTGDLTLGGASILSIVDPGQLTPGFDYAIATYTVSLGGTGAFAGGDNLPKGWYVDYGSKTPKTIMIVPEPATLALLALGGLGLLLGRKRK